jgi:LCP family protein required for cell wall assembly
MRASLDYLIYVCAFAVIGIGCLGAYDAITYPAPADVAPDDGTERAPGPLQVLPPPFPDKRYVTVLIVGADERKDDVGRSDTMIVLFLNPRRSQAALLSIPRDLQVRIPGRGLDKMCHSYSLGGVELTQRTVEQLLDLELDYYAKADFRGFVEVVDMLGGVDIEVPDVEGRGRGMNYDDRADGLHIHLKPGLQQLDGQQAIGFVRYRHGDSDFKRSERQQQFLKAIAEQKLRFANMLQLLKVAPKALECIETDLEWREAVHLARALKQLSADNLLAAQIPARGRMTGGVWYAVASESDIHATLDEIYTHLDSMPARPCPLEVLNGSGKTGVAAAAGSLLSAKGFEVTDTGNADSFDYERTVIEHPRGKENTARMVQRILGCGEATERETDADDEAATIRVIMGADFEQRAKGKGQ